MKKLILIIILLCPIMLLAQVKPVAKPKVQYIIQQQEFNTFQNALVNWHRLSIYDPSLSNDQKVEQTIAIQQYMKDFMTRIKADTVRVDTVKVIAPPKKKK